MRSTENVVTWIVVANSARAVVVSDQGAQGDQGAPAPLMVVQVIRHPEGRKGTGEIVTDRSGRGQSPTGTGTTLAPRTDRRQTSREKFAQELARLLEEARCAKRFVRLVVVASNPFYGVLLDHLGPQVRKCVIRTIERDLSSYPLNQLRNRLEAA
ncbi:MAG: host attachment protein [Betaproteobacteria bacterium]